jgi:hypothetical protein
VTTKTDSATSRSYHRLHKDCIKELLKSHKNGARRAAIKQSFGAFMHFLCAAYAFFMRTEIASL